jgi:AraC-like DNA-binding protein
MKQINVILVRYLVIFLLFSLLTLLFFVPVYRYVMDFTVNNELSHISTRMEQGIVSLDSVFSALDLVSITLRQDSRFSFLKSRAVDPPDWIQIINVNYSTLMELRNSINLALAPYSIDIDAGLLFPDGTAITRTSIYYSPSFVRYYGFVLWGGVLTLEEWRGLLVSNRSFLPAMAYTSLSYDERDAITYSAAWAYSGYHEETVFFAILPVNDIVALLADDDVAGAAHIRMYNGEGEMIFSGGNEIDAFFHVINRGSQANSTRYEILVPDVFITGKLQPVRNLIFLFICITIVLVIIVSFLFAWRSSLPERDFLERFRPAFTTPAAEGLNVFTGLKQIYGNLADSITSRLDTSMRTIETQTALIRTQTIDRIRSALISGDEAAARTVLRDCYAALPRPEDPLIAGLLTGMLYAMLRDVGDELADMVPAFDPPEYTPGGQEEIFEKQYPDCFALICENVQAHKENSMPALGREILAYINQNLCDPGLYIAMAANHFNISPSTLQKLVKQCTGQTFLNYVEKLRIDKACGLLSGSFDSITRIAQACGFSNTTTFYRSFRRLYGFPPSRLQRNR